LTWAEPQHCIQRLRPGTVKRMYYRTREGEPIGYWIACPGCGFVGPYRHEDCGFIEGAMQMAPAVKATGEVMSILRPSTLKATTAPRCYRCHRTIELRETEIDVGNPEK
jgi:hypothetical protein